MTLLEKIRTLNFFDFLRKLKEILLEMYSGMGGGSAIINIIANGDFTIPDGSIIRMITLTGVNPQIVTLPAISDAIGVIYFITNANISDVDINSKSGGNDIWDSNVLGNTKEVVSGTTVRIINDGLNFKIL